MLEDLLPLIAYIMALVAVVWLGLRTPDYVQLGFLTVVGCAMVIYIGADVAMIFGARRIWEIRAIGNSFLFFGLMIYLLRQVWIKTDICRSVK